MIKQSEVEKRLRSGETLRAVAKSLGITYQALQYHRRRWGCKLLRPARTQGKHHASWRGGFFTDRFGYKMVRAPQRGKANPYVPEHLLIAEKKIGRLVRWGEVVHHLNGIKSDNRPQNLIVVTRKRHKELHAQLEAIGFHFLKEGKVIFRPSSGYLPS